MRAGPPLGAGLVVPGGVGQELDVEIQVVAIDPFDARPIRRYGDHVTRTVHRGPAEEDRHRHFLDHDFAIVAAVAAGDAIEVVGAALLVDRGREVEGAMVDGVLAGASTKLSSATVRRGAGRTSMQRRPAARSNPHRAASGCRRRDRASRARPDRYSRCSRTSTDRRPRTVTAGCGPLPLNLVPARSKEPPAPQGFPAAWTTGTGRCKARGRTGLPEHGAQPRLQVGAWAATVDTSDAASPKRGARSSCRRRKQFACQAVRVPKTRIRRGTLVASDEFSRRLRYLWKSGRGSIRGIAVGTAPARGFTLWRTRVEAGDCRGRPSEVQAAEANDAAAFLHRFVLLVAAAAPSVAAAEDARALLDESEARHRSRAQEYRGSLEVVSTGWEGAQEGVAELPQGLCRRRQAPHPLRRAGRGPRRRLSLHGPPGKEPRAVVVSPVDEARAPHRFPGSRHLVRRHRLQLRGHGGLRPREIRGRSPR